MLTGSAGDLEFMVIFSVFFLLPLLIFSWFVAVVLWICDKIDQKKEKDNEH